jgi:hypothetical protein
MEAVAQSYGKSVTVVRTFATEHKVWEKEFDLGVATRWRTSKNPDGSTSRIYVQLRRSERLSRGARLQDARARRRARINLP